MKKILIAVLLMGSVFTACKKNDTPTVAAPSACFTVKHLKVGVGDADTFINCSTNASSYVIDYGDTSGTVTGFSSHGFLNPGTRTVTLTAYNSDKSKSSVVTQTITVDTAYNYPEPVINLTGNTTNFFANQPITFYDTSGLYVTSQIWDFGDGSPVSTEKQPTHTYAHASNQANGQWIITLTTYHNTHALSSTIKKVIDMQ